LRKDIRRKLGLEKFFRETAFGRKREKTREERTKRERDHRSSILR